MVWVYYQVRVTWRGRSPPRRVSHLDLSFMEATIRPMKNVWLQIALAAGLVASIAIGIELSRPLRATREPVAAQIAAHRYIDSSDESVVARALLATAQASDAIESIDSTKADSRTPWASSPASI